jgi:peptidoglycan/xylan/chitin deacetylase (PgdA/CDA1 family)
MSAGTAAAGSDAITTARSQTVPILVYHEVSPHPHPGFRRYTVTLRQFTQQMQWLAVLGYRALDMDTLVRVRLGHGSLPKRPVVITFDDGFQGCADYAVPVLRAHGFTAVFYLVSGLMGETSRWMVPELGLELPLMSWETASALAEEGFQCGAHSVSHPRLAGLTPAQCRAELVDGRRQLEAKLSRAIEHLAYPFGSYNESVRALAAEAGYLSACSTAGGLSSEHDDLLALHRIKIYGHDSLADFICRLNTGTALRQRLSQVLGSMTQRFGRFRSSRQ